MIDWQVIVPIKQGMDGKSRLGGLFESHTRSNLAERMATHVLNIVQQCVDISRITILSQQRPQNWRGEWVGDEGRGLNMELSAWRVAQGDAAILFLHADLPLLTTEDVQAMLDIADHGAALATDRAGLGTNALALADGRPMTLRFGANSRALHCAQHPDMPVLQREGLMADFDTPEDAQFLAARGYTV